MTKQKSGEKEFFLSNSIHIIQHPAHFDLLKQRSFWSSQGRCTVWRKKMSYEPKNILITGGAGFIASHVAILFAKKYPHCKVSLCIV